MHQPDQKCSRRAKPGSCGNVGDAESFERVGRCVQSQSLAQEWVPNLFVGLGVLRFRILEEISRQETLVNRDVDVFVDCRRDYESAEFTVVRRQIGTTASDGDAKRSARDDHRSPPPTDTNSLSMA